MSSVICLKGQTMHTHTPSNAQTVCNLAAFIARGQNATQWERAKRRVRSEHNFSLRAQGLAFTCTCAWYVFFFVALLLFQRSVFMLRLHLASRHYHQMRLVHVVQCTRQMNKCLPLAWSLSLSLTLPLGTHNFTLRLQFQLNASCWIQSLWWWVCVGMMFVLRT